MVFGVDYGLQRLSRYWLIIPAKKKITTIFINENRPSCDGLAKEEELKKKPNLYSTDLRADITDKLQT